MLLTPGSRNLTQNYATKSPLVFTPPIKPTGCYEFWLHDVDLVIYKAEQNPKQTPLDTESNSPQPCAPPPLILPGIYKPCMTCIYNTQSKCVGMITPSRFQILYKAFYKAKLASSHETVTPPPTSFASELQGHLTRKTMLENKYAS
eukprot:592112-Pelagomonas_calceolata.AAC.1